jgi:hypothetical protein
MNWYKLSSLSEKNLNNSLKSIIKTNSFFKKLFNLFKIPLSQIDNNLTFYIKDLNGKNAKSIDNNIYFDKNLFNKNDFLKNGIHFVVHEMIHWLTRQKESNCYFSDPEEIQAFTFGIAWEIKRGTKQKDIDKIYFPIIQKHFKDNKDCINFYNKLISKAKSISDNI